MQRLDRHDFSLEGIVATVALTAVSGLIAGYGFFLLGTLLSTVSGDAAFKVTGVVTVAVWGGVARFLWRNFYGPNAPPDGD